MEVKILSKDCIKPTSPTPNHLKTHKLSLLDQVVPSVHFPLVLFYPNTTRYERNREIHVLVRSQILRQSLARTLTDSYPLAGKLRDKFSIDCDDEGAYYIEAEAECTLFEYLDNVDLPSLHKLIPAKFDLHEAAWGSHAAMVQETRFKCGTIALGILVSHMAVDGTALSFFLNAWAVKARGDQEPLRLNFIDGPLIFPQCSEYPREETILGLFGRFIRQGKTSTRRFVFDGSAIADLKAKATSPSVANPSRVEVVTALLCKCIRAALHANSSLKRPLAFAHAVNLRPRATNPALFRDYLMGNCVWNPTILCGVDKAEFASYVSLMREEMRKINAEFVNDLKGEGGFKKICELMKNKRESFDALASTTGLDFIGFSSWSSFGLYDIDFGWGKPIWSTYVGLGESEFESEFFMNNVVLTDTRDGKGLEAWVSLAEEELVMLENDKELNAYASINPRPSPLT